MQGNSVVFKVARMNSNGSPDSSFGGTGEVYLKVGTNTSPRAVALQPDGKIVVGGTTWYQGPNAYKAVVARYNSNGTLDKGFGNKGTFVWDRTGEVTDLALRPDGSMIAAGWNCTAFALSAAGSVVTSFGNQGLATSPVGGGPAHVAVKPDDGKVFLVGNSANDLATIVAYTSAGQADTSFGGAGYVQTVGFSGGSYSDVVLQDNNILAVGYANGPSSPEGLLARYQLDGTLDTSFADQGILFTTYADNVSSVALESDGSIIIGGSQNNQAMVGHLTHDGAWDKTFGTSGTGIVTTELGPQGRYVQTLAIAPDGSIVVGMAKGSKGVFARLTSPLA